MRIGPIDRVPSGYESRRFCFFVTPVVAAVADAVASAATAVGIGEAAAGTIGAIAGPALVGAGGGAALSGITGGDPGTGALTGALTGGLGGAGGVVGPEVGIGASAGEAIGGAAGGAIGAGATGGNPLTGAAIGAIPGVVGGLTGGDFFGGSTGGVSNAVGSSGQFGESGGFGEAGSSPGTGSSPGASLTASPSPPLGSSSPATGISGGTGALSSSLGTDIPGASTPTLGGATGAPSPISPANLGTGADPLSGGDSTALVRGAALGNNALQGTAFEQPSITNLAGGITSSPSSPGTLSTTDAAGNTLSVNTGAPPGLDPIAAANFNAENTANPAQSALNANAINSALGPGTATAPGAAASGTPPTKPGFFNQDLFGTGITPKDLAGPLVSAGVLGFEALNKPKLPSSASSPALTSNLSTSAQQLQTQGTALTQPLTTGVLPAGAQSAIDQATQSAKAEVRSRFASLGLTGSTMEAGELASLDAGAVQQKFDVAKQLAQTGLSEIGLSDQVFNNLLQNALQQDEAFNQAVSRFASSFAGGGGNQITLRAA